MSKGCSERGTVDASRGPLHIGQGVRNEGLSGSVSSAPCERGECSIASDYAFNELQGSACPLGGAVGTVIPERRAQLPTAGGCPPRSPPVGFGGMALWDRTS